MDQLKTILAQVKKYHFWVLCGIAVVVPLGLTFTAGGQMSRNTKARATEVAGVRTQVKQVKDTPDPPNESSKQAVEKAHEGLRNEVYDAWDYLYQEQAKNIQWPSALGSVFLAHMRARGANDPIEDDDRATYQYFIRKHIPKLFLDEKDLSDDDKKLRLGLSVRMTPEERKEYLALVQGAPKPKTKKPDPAAEAKPGAKSPVAKSGAQSDAGAAQSAASEELQGTVDWDYTLRQELESRYLWDRPPTTSQVLMAQEDLWVLEALVRILKETNKNATSQYNAPVKAIYALTIGQEAAIETANSQARIFQSYGLGSGAAPSGYGPGGAAGSPAPGGMPMAPGGGGFTGPGGGVPMGPSHGSITGPSGGGSAGAIPATPGGGGGGASSDMGSGGAMGPGRFPGGPGPMSMGMSGAGGLGGQAPGMAMAGLSEDEQWAMTLRNFRYVDQNGYPLPYNATPPFKQFKMIPVHMLLVIDQRELPRLLANCANSEMPVVVRRVAVHPEEGGSGSLSGSPGGVTGVGSSDSGRSKRGGSQMPGPSRGGLKKGGDYGKTRPRGSGPSGAYGAGAATADEFSEEMVAEIQGIIYFFNPPPPKTVALATGAVSPTQPATVPGGGVPPGKP